ncbi:MAG: sulfite exporter TauE/SafE family protein [Alphaproteobacteria bacterium]|nr:MAG: sulfite exporter TauE/SafE family protein [Alphaproteobacteria bacterium]
MIPGVALGELAWLALAIVAGGVVTGILAGLFGIGGGAVIVPVLYEVFRVIGVPEEVRMQLCIGTSLAIIVPTTIRSYYAHRARGAVLPDVMRIWMVPMVVGVAAGAGIATFAPQAVFKIAFVVLAMIISARLFGGDRWRLGDTLPGRFAMTIYGLAIGLASSLMGVSGGSMSTMVLTLYGKPIHAAVGTAAGLGVPLTIAGTIGYVLAGLPHQASLPPLSIGFVSLIGVALMAPVSSFMASYGVRLAHWLPKRQLEIAFGIFLLLVSVRFIVSLV